MISILDTVCKLPLSYCEHSDYLGGSFTISMTYVALCPITNEEIDAEGLHDWLTTSKQPCHSLNPGFLTFKSRVSISKT